MTCQFTNYNDQLYITPIEGVENKIFELFEDKLQAKLDFHVYETTNKWKHVVLSTFPSEENSRAEKLSAFFDNLSNLLLTLIKENDISEIIVCHLSKHYVYNNIRYYSVNPYWFYIRKGETKVNIHSEYLQGPWKDSGKQRIFLEPFNDGPWFKTDKQDIEL